MELNTSRSPVKVLIQERATRSHFLECMRTKLSALWKDGRTESAVYKRTKARYDLFDARIAELDDMIYDKLCPVNNQLTLL